MGRPYMEVFGSRFFGIPITFLGIETVVGPQIARIVRFSRCERLSNQIVFVIPRYLGKSSI